MFENRDFENKNFKLVAKISNYIFFWLLLLLFIKTKPVKQKETEILNQIKVKKKLKILSNFTI